MSYDQVNDALYEIYWTMPVPRVLCEAKYNSGHARLFWLGQLDMCHSIGYTLRLARHAHGKIVSLERADPQLEFQFQFKDN